MKQVVAIQNEPPIRLLQQFRLKWDGNGSLSRCDDSENFFFQIFKKIMELSLVRQRALIFFWFNCSYQQNILFSLNSHWKLHPLSIHWPNINIFFIMYTCCSLFPLNITQIIIDKQKNRIFSKLFTRFAPVLLYVILSHQNVIMNSFNHYKLIVIWRSYAYTYSTPLT